MGGGLCTRLPWPQQGIAALTSVDGIRAEARTASRTTFFASVRFSSYRFQAVAWAPLSYLKIAEPRSTTAKPVGSEHFVETCPRLVTWVVSGEGGEQVAGGAWLVFPNLPGVVFGCVTFPRRLRHASDSAIWLAGNRQVQISVTGRNFYRSTTSRFQRPNRLSYKL